MECGGAATPLLERAERGGVSVGFPEFFSVMGSHTVSPATSGPSTKRCRCATALQSAPLTRRVSPWPMNAIPIRLPE